MDVLLQQCFLCETHESTEKCDLCPVHFCSEHKEYHRPARVAKCLPWKVGKSDSVGRFLKASNSVQKGQVVIFDKAFTLGPITTPTCLGCLLPMKEPVSCPKCNLPMCSLNCEFLQLHASQECEIISQSKLIEFKVDTAQPNTFYNCIGLMRMILKMQDKKDKSLPEVLKLMAHLTERFGTFRLKVTQPCN